MLAIPGAAALDSGRQVGLRAEIKETFGLRYAVDATMGQEIESISRERRRPSEPRRQRVTECRGQPSHGERDTTTRHCGAARVRDRRSKLLQRNMFRSGEVETLSDGCVADAATHEGVGHVVDVYGVQQHGLCADRAEAPLQ